MRGEFELACVCEVGEVEPRVKEWKKERDIEAGVSMFRTPSSALAPSSSATQRRCRRNVVAASVAQPRTSSDRHADVFRRRRRRLRLPSFQQHRKNGFDVQPPLSRIFDSTLIFSLSLSRPLSLSLECVAVAAAALWKGRGDRMKSYVAERGRQKWKEKVEKEVRCWQQSVEEMRHQSTKVRMSCPKGCLQRMHLVRHRHAQARNLQRSERCLGRFGNPEREGNVAGMRRSWCCCCCWCWCCFASSSEGALLVEPFYRWNLFTRSLPSLARSSNIIIRTLFRWI